jgi:hypothetical protein
VVGRSLVVEVAPAESAEEWLLDHFCFQWQKVAGWMGRGEEDPWFVSEAASDEGEEEVVGLIRLLQL